MYECLFTYDSNLAPIPDLAESYERSSDGLTYTLKLQKGVLFHNGKELTAEDVEASLRRWATISGVGETFFERVDSMTFPDDYTIVFKLKEVYPLFETALAIASQGPVIYPKEVVEEAGEGEIQQYIGTGPYKFEEWDRDRLIRIVRFEDYVPHGDQPNGYGGKKMAYLDEIIFYIVEDQSTRLAGLLAGDYDRIDSPGGEEYERLKADPDVKVIYSNFAGVWENVLNLKSPITGDQKLRQAMMAATDPEPICLARTAGNPDMFQVSAALADGAWYTEKCGEQFGKPDLDEAKRLLAESNYNGETIRWLTAGTPFYELSVVHSQQLEAIGLKIELLQSDWATVTERRNKEEGWEVMATGWGYKADPLLSPQFMGTFVGWWQTERAEALREQMLVTPDADERFKLWEQLQCLWYEEVPCLSYGKGRGWNAVKPKLMNDEWLEDITRGMWNAYFTP
jgi:peptide/nickel transport system substrate-binding protein